MDITPHVNLLRSLRGERTNYVSLIGEGVDNAFDAAAGDVAITLSDDQIIFKDNGSGITKARIGAIFSLGKHGAMSTTQLGRFGVGIKSQAVNAGDILRVESRSHDGLVKVEVNWRHILDGGEWKIDDPRWLPVAIDKPKGSTITIARLRHRPKFNKDKILEELAQRFYPAIAEGKIITFNGIAVPLLSDPKLSDIVEREMSLSGDRSCRVRAGVLCEPSALNRVHVGYKHRVIMPGSPLGCGEYGGLTKMFARVQISGSWFLAKFKDDISDDVQREELEEAVGAVLRPILEKVSTAQMSARIDKMAHVLNEALPESLAPARPRRSSVTKQTSSKGGRSGVVDEAKSDIGGPAKTKRPPRDALLITFDGILEKDGIGEFQAGRPHRVNLSKDHPLIESLLALRDEEMARECLSTFALMIFEHGREIAEDQKELEFAPFGVRIAKHLSIQVGAAEKRGAA